MSSPHNYLSEAHKAASEKAMEALKNQTPTTNEEFIKQTTDLAKLSKRDKTKPYIPLHMR